MNSVILLIIKWYIYMLIGMSVCSYVWTGVIDKAWKDVQLSPVGLYEKGRWLEKRDSIKFYSIDSCMVWIFQWAPTKVVCFNFLKK